MGVHDVEATRKAKELLGIPVDEPVFILRAQDVLYPAAIACYGQLYAATCRSAHVLRDPKGTRSRAIQPSSDEWAFLDHIEACEDIGRRWQKRNPEKVKIPD